MKKIFKLVLAVIILMSIHSSSFAQDDDESYSKPSTPRWVSDKGYWMIESNIYSPRKYLIYFYNNNSELIYKENIEGVYLDLNRTRVKMNLKRALEIALIAWQKEQKLKENESLVINYLRRKK